MRGGDTLVHYDLYIHSSSLSASDPRVSTNRGSAYLTHHRQISIRTNHFVQVHNADICGVDDLPGNLSRDHIQLQVPMHTDTRTHIYSTYADNRLTRCGFNLVYTITITVLH